MKGTLKWANRKLAAVTGHSVVRNVEPQAIARVKATPWPDDLQEIIDRVTPYTMTSPERIVAVCDAMDHMVEYEIDAAVVECGVWRGGSMMAAALRLAQHNTERDLWLYDTFDGVTEPDPVLHGHRAMERYLSSNPRGSGSDWCFASLNDVMANMRSTEYPMSRVRFVKGMVEDTIPGQMPEVIGLLRIDTDLYSSTRHVLEHLAPKLFDGGLVHLDDYGAWDGARKAADEWRQCWPKPLPLHRIAKGGNARAISLLRP